MAVKTSADEISSDSELLARFRAGERDAFAQLYARHHGRAIQQARSLSRSSTDAHDIVSDAFTQILAALDNSRGPTENFGAYLGVCIRNAAATPPVVLLK